MDAGASAPGEAASPPVPPGVAKLPPGPPVSGAGFTTMHVAGPTPAPVPWPSVELTDRTPFASIWMLSSATMIAGTTPVSNTGPLTVSDLTRHTHTVSPSMVSSMHLVVTSIVPGGGL